MNILYVLHDFFPRFYGGTERYVLNIAKYMQKLGHGVKVLTYGLEDLPESFQPRGDILQRRYVHEGVPVLSIRHRTIPADVGYRIRDPEIENGLRAILEEESFDVMHIAHPMRMASAAGIAQSLGKPVILTLTDFWLLCPRGRMYKLDYSPCSSPERGTKCARECALDKSIYTRYEDAETLFKSVDMLLAPSRFLIEIFRENGWDRDILPVRHGVDYHYVGDVNDTKPRRNGAIVFGFTGVVSKFKGVDLLVDAFKRVKAENIQLKIYGNSVWEAGYDDKIRSDAAGDQRIEFMGNYNHDDLHQIMRGIDIMVVPSSTLESYGLVVVESLAHKVPVIASNIVGSAFEYIQDGVNGFIFDLNHPERLSEIIQKLADNPALLDSLRQHVTYPPRLEEEGFELEGFYKKLAANS